MASRKKGEKKYLDIMHGWLNGEGPVQTAYAMWHIPEGRAWGEWRVIKTCRADMNDSVELALAKHGKDPDAAGHNFTTGQVVPNWEK